jgi:hypothetical protein
MAHMAVVYRRPVGVMRQSVKPQLASWDRAGYPSQVKLARFLAHVDAIAGPVLATASGRVAAELIVGLVMAAMTWTTTYSRSLSGWARSGWQLSSAARFTGRRH